MKRDVMIEDTGFTIGTILDRIAETSKTSGQDIAEKLLDFTVRDITGGIGFFGRILQLKFVWRQPGDHLISVVLKIPGMQQYREIRESVPDANYDIETEVKRNAEYLTHAHEGEIIFYKRFGNGKSELVLPQFYYGHSYSPLHQNGLIMMEDLSERSSCAALIPGFNNAQMEVLVEQIAILHATSLSQSSELISELPAAALLDHFANVMKNTTMDLVKIRPEYFKNSLEKLLPLFTIESLHKVGYEEERHGLPAVLLHGDLWSSNVLWEKNKDGTLSDQLSGLIDWQTIHLGNPCEDLLRLLSINVDSKYRRENTERLVRLYCDKMVERGAQQFSYEKVMEAYRAALPYTCMYLGFGSVMYYHMGTVCRDEEQKEELMLRVKAFFDDVVDEYRL